MIVEGAIGRIAEAAGYRTVAAEVVVTGNAGRSAAQSSGCPEVEGRIWSGLPAARSAAWDSSSAAAGLRFTVSVNDSTIGRQS